MQPLSASELLRVWEEGQGEPPYRQALLLLAAACPEESPEEILSLSIGSRDSRLLTLREWTFGAGIDEPHRLPGLRRAAGIQLERVRHPRIHSRGEEPGVTPRTR